MRGLFIISLFCCQLSMLHAQTIEPRHTFNLELGLPNGMTNKPFKNIMQGLANVAPYYQFAFKNHLILGAGLMYSYYTINEFKVPKKVYGGMHTGGVFVKVGWEKFHTERFATDFSLKIGYTQSYFDTDMNKVFGQNPYVAEASYVEPTMGLILTADETTSFRFFIGYGFQGYAFQPYMIGLQTLGGYEPKEFSKINGSLLAGFGFTYYFKPKN